MGLRQSSAPLTTLTIPSPTNTLSRFITAINETKNEWLPSTITNDQFYLYDYTFKITMIQTFMSFLLKLGADASLRNSQFIENVNFSLLRYALIAKFPTPILKLILYNNAPIDFSIPFTVLQPYCTNPDFIISLLAVGLPLQRVSYRHIDELLTMPSVLPQHIHQRQEEAKRQILIHHYRKQKAVYKNRQRQEKIINSSDFDFRNTKLMGSLQSHENGMKLRSSYRANTTTGTNPRPLNNNNTNNNNNHNNNDIPSIHKIPSSRNNNNKGRGKVNPPQSGDHRHTPSDELDSEEEHDEDDDEEDFGEVDPFFNDETFDQPHVRPKNSRHNYHERYDLSLHHACCAYPQGTLNSKSKSQLLYPVYQFIRFYQFQQLCSCHVKTHHNTREITSKVINSTSMNQLMLNAISPHRCFTDFQCRDPGHSFSSLFPTVNRFPTVTQFLFSSLPQPFHKLLFYDLFQQPFTIPLESIRFNNQLNYIHEPLTYEVIMDYICDPYDHFCFHSEELMNPEPCDSTRRNSVTSTPIPTQHSNPKLKQNPHNVYEQTDEEAFSAYEPHSQFISFVPFTATPTQPSYLDQLNVKLDQKGAIPRNNSLLSTNSTTKHSSETDDYLYSSMTQDLDHIVPQISLLFQPRQHYRLVDTRLESNFDVIKKQYDIFRSQERLEYQQQQLQQHLQQKHHRHQQQLSQQDQQQLSQQEQELIEKQRLSGHQEIEVKGSSFTLKEQPLTSLAFDPAPYFVDLFERPDHCPVLGPFSVRVENSISSFVDPFSQQSSSLQSSSQLSQSIQQPGGLNTTHQSPNPRRSFNDPFELHLHRSRSPSLPSQSGFREITDQALELSSISVNQRLPLPPSRSSRALAVNTINQAINVRAPIDFRGANYSMYSTINTLENEQKRFIQRPEQKYTIPQEYLNEDESKQIPHGGFFKEMMGSNFLSKLEPFTSGADLPFHDELNILNTLSAPRYLKELLILNSLIPKRAPLLHHIFTIPQLHLVDWFLVDLYYRHSGGLIWQLLLNLPSHQHEEISYLFQALTISNPLTQERCFVCPIRQHPTIPLHPFMYACLRQFPLDVLLLLLPRPQDINFISPRQSLEFSNNISTIIPLVDNYGRNPLMWYFGSWQHRFLHIPIEHSAPTSPQYIPFMIKQYLSMELFYKCLKLSNILQIDVYHNSALHYLFSIQLPSKYARLDNNFIKSQPMAILLLPETVNSTLSSSPSTIPTPLPTPHSASNPNNASNASSTQSTTTASNNTNSSTNSNPNQQRPTSTHQTTKPLSTSPSTLRELMFVHPLLLLFNIIVTHCVPQLFQYNFLIKTNKSNHSFVHTLLLSLPTHTVHYLVFTYYHIHCMRFNLSNVTHNYIFQLNRDLRNYRDLFATKFRPPKHNLSACYQCQAANPSVGSSNIASTFLSSEPSGYNSFSISNNNQDTSPPTESAETALITPPIVYQLSPVDPRSYNSHNSTAPHTVPTTISTIPSHPQPGHLPSSQTLVESNFSSSIQNSDGSNNNNITPFAIQSTPSPLHKPPIQLISMTPTRPNSQMPSANHRVGPYHSSSQIDPHINNSSHNPSTGAQIVSRSNSVLNTNSSTFKSPGHLQSYITPTGSRDQGNIHDGSHQSLNYNNYRPSVGFAENLLQIESYYLTTHHTPPINLNTGDTFSPTLQLPVGNTTYSYGFSSLRHDPRGTLGSQPNPFVDPYRLNHKISNAMIILSQSSLRLGKPLQKHLKQPFALLPYTHTPNTTTPLPMTLTESYMLRAYGVFPQLSSQFHKDRSWYGGSKRSKGDHQKHHGELNTDGVAYKEFENEYILQGDSNSSECSESDCDEDYDYEIWKAHIAMVEEHQQQKAISKAQQKLNQFEPSSPRPQPLGLGPLDFQRRIGNAQINRSDPDTVKSKEQQHQQKDVQNNNNNNSNNNIIDSALVGRTDINSSPQSHSIDSSNNTIKNSIGGKPPYPLLSMDSSSPLNNQDTDSRNSSYQLIGTSPTNTSSPASKQKKLQPSQAQSRQPDPRQSNPTPPSPASFPPSVGQYPSYNILSQESQLSLQQDQKEDQTQQPQQTQQSQQRPQQPYNQAYGPVESHEIDYINPIYISRRQHRKRLRQEYYQKLIKYQSELRFDNQLVLEDIRFLRKQAVILKLIHGAGPHNARYSYDKIYYDYEPTIHYFLGSYFALQYSIKTGRLYNYLSTFLEPNNHLIRSFHRRQLPLLQLLQNPKTLLPILILGSYSECPVDGIIGLDPLHRPLNTLQTLSLDQLRASSGPNYKASHYYNTANGPNNNGANNLFSLLHQHVDSNERTIIQSKSPFLPFALKNDYGHSNSNNTGINTTAPHNSILLSHGHQPFSTNSPNNGNIPDQPPQQHHRRQLDNEASANPFNEDSSSVETAHTVPIRQDSRISTRAVEVASPANLYSNDLSSRLRTHMKTLLHFNILDLLQSHFTQQQYPLIYYPFFSHSWLFEAPQVDSKTTTASIVQAHNQKASYLSPFTSQTSFLQNNLATGDNSILSSNNLPNTVALQQHPTHVEFETGALDESRLYINSIAPTKLKIPTRIGHPRGNSDLDEDGSGDDVHIEDSQAVPNTLTLEDEDEDQIDYSLVCYNNLYKSLPKFTVRDNSIAEIPFMNNHAHLTRALVRKSRQHSDNQSIMTGSSGAISTQLPKARRREKDRDYAELNLTTQPQRSIANSSMYKDHESNKGGSVLGDSPAISREGPQSSRGTSRSARRSTGSPDAPTTNHRSSRSSRASSHESKLRVRPPTHNKDHSIERPTVANTLIKSDQFDHHSTSSIHSPITERQPITSPNCFKAVSWLHDRRLPTYIPSTSFHIIDPYAPIIESYHHLFSDMAPLSPNLITTRVTANYRHTYNLVKMFKADFPLSPATYALTPSLSGCPRNTLSDFIPNGANPSSSIHALSMVPIYEIATERRPDIPPQDPDLATTTTKARENTRNVQPELSVNNSQSFSHVTGMFDSEGSVAYSEDQRMTHTVPLTDGSDISLYSYLGKGLDRRIDLLIKQNKTGLQLGSIKPHQDLFSLHHIEFHTQFFLNLCRQNNQNSPIPITPSEDINSSKAPKTNDILNINSPIGGFASLTAQAGFYSHLDFQDSLIQPILKSQFPLHLFRGTPEYYQLLHLVNPSLKRTHQPAQRRRLIPAQSHTEPSTITGEQSHASLSIQVNRARSNFHIHNTTQNAENGSGTGLNADGQVAIGLFDPKKSLNNPSKTANLLFKDDELAQIEPDLMELLREYIPEFTPLLRPTHLGQASFELSPGALQLWESDLWLETLNIDIHDALYPAYEDNFTVFPTPPTLYYQPDRKTTDLKLRSKDKTMLRSGGGTFGYRSATNNALISTPSLTSNSNLHIRNLHRMITPDTISNNSQDDDGGSHPILHYTYQTHSGRLYDDTASHTECESGSSRSFQSHRSVINTHSQSGNPVDVQMHLVSLTDEDTVNRRFPSFVSPAENARRLKPSPSNFLGGSSFGAFICKLCREGGECEYYCVLRNQMREHNFTLTQDLEARVDVMPSSAFFHPPSRPRSGSAPRSSFDRLIGGNNPNSTSPISTTVNAPTRAPMNSNYNDASDPLDYAHAQMANYPNQVRKLPPIHEVDEGYNTFRYTGAGILPIFGQIVSSFAQLSTLKLSHVNTATNFQRIVALDENLAIQRQQSLQQKKQLKLDKYKKLLQQKQLEREKRRTARSHHRSNPRTPFPLLLALGNRSGLAQLDLYGPQPNLSALYASTSSARPRYNISLTQDPMASDPYSYGCIVAPKPPLPPQAPKENLSHTEEVDTNIEEDDGDLESRNNKSSRIDSLSQNTSKSGYSSSSYASSVDSSSENASPSTVRRRRRNRKRLDQVQQDLHEEQLQTAVLPYVPLMKIPPESHQTRSFFQTATLMSQFSPYPGAFIPYTISHYQGDANGYWHDHLFHEYKQLKGQDIATVTHLFLTTEPRDFHCATIVDFTSTISESLQANGFENISILDPSTLSQRLHAVLGPLLNPVRVNTQPSPHSNQSPEYLKPIIESKSISDSTQYRSLYDQTRGFGTPNHQLFDLRDVQLLSFLMNALVASQYTSRHSQSNPLQALSLTDFTRYQQNLLANPHMNVPTVAIEGTIPSSFTQTQTPIKSVWEYHLASCASTGILTLMNQMLRANLSLVRVMMCDTEKLEKKQQMDELLRNNNPEYNHIGPCHKKDGDSNHSQKRHPITTGKPKKIHVPKNKLAHSTSMDSSKGTTTNNLTSHLPTTHISATSFSHAIDSKRRLPIRRMGSLPDILRASDKYHQERRAGKRPSKSRPKMRVRSKSKSGSHGEIEEIPSDSGLPQRSASPHRNSTPTRRSGSSIHYGKKRYRAIHILNTFNSTHTRSPERLIDVNLLTDFIKYLARPSTSTITSRGDLNPEVDRREVQRVNPTPISITPGPTVIDLDFSSTHLQQPLSPLPVLTMNNDQKRSIHISNSAPRLGSTMSNGGYQRNDPDSLNNFLPNSSSLHASNASTSRSIINLGVISSNTVGSNNARPVLVNMSDQTTNHSINRTFSNRYSSNGDSYQSQPSSPSSNPRQSPKILSLTQSCGTQNQFNPTSNPAPKNNPPGAASPTHSTSHFNNPNEKQNTSKVSLSRHTTRLACYLKSLNQKILSSKDPRKSSDHHRRANNSSWALAQESLFGSQLWIYSLVPTHSLPRVDTTTPLASQPLLKQSAPFSITNTGSRYIQIALSDYLSYYLPAWSTPGHPNWPNDELSMTKTNCPWEETPPIDARLFPNPFVHGHFYNARVGASNVLSFRKSMDELLTPIDEKPYYKQLSDMYYVDLVKRYRTHLNTCEQKKLREGTLTSDVGQVPRSPLTPLSYPTHKPSPGEDRLTFPPWILDYDPPESDCRTFSREQYYSIIQRIVNNHSRALSHPHKDRIEIITAGLPVLLTDEMYNYCVTKFQRLSPSTSLFLAQALAQEYIRLPRDASRSLISNPSNETVDETKQSGETTSFDTPGTQPVITTTPAHSHSIGHPRSTNQHTAHNGNIIAANQSDRDVVDSFGILQQGGLSIEDDHNIITTKDKNRATEQLHQAHPSSSEQQVHTTPSTVSSISQLFIQDGRDHLILAALFDLGTITPSLYEITIPPIPQSSTRGIDDFIKSLSDDKKNINNKNNKKDAKAYNLPLTNTITPSSFIPSHDFHIQPQQYDNLPNSNIILSRPSTPQSIGATRPGYNVNNNNPRPIGGNKIFGSSASEMFNNSSTPHYDNNNGIINGRGVGTAMMNGPAIMSNSGSNIMNNSNSMMHNCSIPIINNSVNATTHPMITNSSLNDSALNTNQIINNSGSMTNNNSINNSMNIGINNSGGMFMTNTGSIMNNSVPLGTNNGMMFNNYNLAMNNSVQSLITTPKSTGPSPHGAGNIAHHNNLQNNSIVMMNYPNGSYNNGMNNNIPSVINPHPSHLSSLTPNQMQLNTRSAHQDTPSSTDHSTATPNLINDKLRQAGQTLQHHFQTPMIHFGPYCLYHPFVSPYTIPTQFTSMIRPLGNPFIHDINNHNHPNNKLDKSNNLNINNGMSYRSSSNHGHSIHKQPSISSSNQSISSPSPSTQQFNNWNNHPSHGGNLPLDTTTPPGANPIKSPQRKEEKKARKELSEKDLLWLHHLEVLHTVYGIDPSSWLSITRPNTARVDPIILTGMTSQLSNRHLQYVTPLTEFVIITAQIVRFQTSLRQGMMELLWSTVLPNYHYQNEVQGLAVSLFPYTVYLQLFSVLPTFPQRPLPTLTYIHQRNSLKPSEHGDNITAIESDASPLYKSEQSFPLNNNKTSKQPKEGAKVKRAKDVMSKCFIIPEAELTRDDLSLHKALLPIPSLLVGIARYSPRDEISHSYADSIFSWFDYHHHHQVETALAVLGTTNTQSRELLRSLSHLPSRSVQWHKIEDMESHDELEMMYYSLARPFVIPTESVDIHYYYTIPSIRDKNNEFFTMTMPRMEFSLLCFDRQFVNPYPLTYHDYEINYSLQLTKAYQDLIQDENIYTPILCRNPKSFSNVISGLSLRTLQYYYENNRFLNSISLFSEIAAYREADQTKYFNIWTERFRRFNERYRALNKPSSHPKNPEYQPSDGNSNTTNQKRKNNNNHSNHFNYNSNRPSDSHSNDQYDTNNDPQWGRGGNIPLTISNKHPAQPTPSPNNGGYTPLDQLQYSPFVPGFENYNQMIRLDERHYLHPTLYQPVIAFSLSKHLWHFTSQATNFIPEYAAIPTQTIQQLKSSNEYLQLVELTSDQLYIFNSLSSFSLTNLSNFHILDPHRRLQKRAIDKSLVQQMKPLESGPSPYHNNGPLPDQTKAPSQEQTKSPDLSTIKFASYPTQANPSQPVPIRVDLLNNSVNYKTENHYPSQSQHHQTNQRNQYLPVLLCHDANLTKHTPSPQPLVTSPTNQIDLVRLLSVSLKKQLDDLDAIFKSPEHILWIKPTLVTQTIKNENNSQGFMSLADEPTFLISTKLVDTLPVAPDFSILESNVINLINCIPQLFHQWFLYNPCNVRAKFNLVQNQGIFNIPLSFYTVRIRHPDVQLKPIIPCESWKWITSKKQSIRQFWDMIQKGVPKPSSHAARTRPSSYPPVIKKFSPNFIPQSHWYRLNHLHKSPGVKTATPSLPTLFDHMEQLIQQSLFLPQHLHQRALAMEAVPCVAPPPPESDECPFDDSPLPQQFQPKSIETTTRKGRQSTLNMTRDRTKYGAWNPYGVGSSHYHTLPTQCTCLLDQISKVGKWFGLLRDHSPAGTLTHTLSTQPTIIGVTAGKGEDRISLSHHNINGGVSRTSLPNPANEEDDGKDEGQNNISQQFSRLDILPNISTAPPFSPTASLPNISPQFDPHITCESLSALAHELTRPYSKFHEVRFDIKGGDKLSMVTTVLTIQPWMLMMSSSRSDRSRSRSTSQTRNGTSYDRLPNSMIGTSAAVSTHALPQPKKQSSTSINSPHNGVAHPPGQYLEMAPIIRSPDYVPKPIFFPDQTPMLSPQIIAAASAANGGSSALQPTPLSREESVSGARNSRGNSRQRRRSAKERSGSAVRTSRVPVYLPLQVHQRYTSTPDGNRDHTQYLAQRLKDEPLAYGPISSQMITSDARYAYLKVFLFSRTSPVTLAPDHNFTINGLVWTSTSHLKENGKQIIVAPGDVPLLTLEKVEQKVVEKQIAKNQKNKKLRDYHDTYQLQSLISHAIRLNDESHFLTSSLLVPFYMSPLEAYKYAQEYPDGLLVCIGVLSTIYSRRLLSQSQLFIHPYRYTESSRLYLASIQSTTRKQQMGSRVGSGFDIRRLGYSVAALRGRNTNFIPDSAQQLLNHSSTTLMHQKRIHESYLEFNHNFHLYQFKVQVTFNFNSFSRNIPRDYAQFSRCWYHISSSYMNDTSWLSPDDEVDSNPTSASKPLPQFVPMISILNYQVASIPSFSTNILSDSAQFSTTNEGGSAQQNFEYNLALHRFRDMESTLPLTSDHLLPVDPKRDWDLDYPNSYLMALGHPQYPYPEQEFTQIPIYPNLSNYCRPQRRGRSRTRTEDVPSTTPSWATEGASTPVAQPSLNRATDQPNFR